jgi:phosphoribosylamine--glycine ligase
VVGQGADFAEARSRAYQGLAKIQLEGGQFRTDIAQKVVQ